MSHRADVLRQLAVVFGSVLQVAAAGNDVARISAENRSLVVPSAYAFSIWGPIFGLAFAYAIYQALPRNRARPILRRTGWFVAGAYTMNGVWEIVFPARQFVLAEVIIVIGCGFAAAAYLRVVRGGPVERRDAWLVGLPVGLLFGWLTAATAVSVATTLVALGLDARGWVAALSGAVLLLAAGLGAAWAVRAGRAGPASAWGAYAFAVLWALVAIVVNQYDDSLVTTMAAVAAGVPVAVVLAGRGRKGHGRSARASLAS